MRVVSQTMSHTHRTRVVSHRWFVYSKPTLPIIMSYRCLSEEESGMVSLSSRSKQVPWHQDWKEGAQAEKSTGGNEARLNSSSQAPRTIGRERVIPCDRHGGAPVPDGNHCDRPDTATPSRWTFQG
ncbi:hypothetical protein VTI74DRAFT_1256 [Chaetomium olivicolor]